MPSVFSAGSASVKIVPDFKGAQTAISQWFRGQNDMKVSVKPDLDQAQMARVQQQLNQTHAKASVDIDHDYLARSIAKAMDSLTGASEVASVISKTITPLMFAGAIGGLTSMAAAASQSVGALALIPAAITAAAAPIAVMTIGVQGMGEAFKAVAEGDVEKMRVALDNLAPSARAFVLQMHDLAPAFHDLRLDIQQELFRGLGTEVSTLATKWLPTLHTGLTTLAGGMRDIVTEGLRVASSQQSIADGAATFANINAMFAEMKPILGDLIAIWRDFATIGSEFLPGLGAGLADMVARLREWVAVSRDSGELFNIISRGLSVIGDLFQLLGQIGRVFIELFRPAIEAGTTLINLFTDLFGKVADFLALDTTQSSLKVFFDSIASAFHALEPAILVVVDVLTTALLPAVGQLFAALAPFVATILSEFAELFRDLAPLIPIVSEAILALLEAFEPLIPVISQIITSLLPPLASIVTALAPIIGDLARAVGDALVSALNIIAPVLPILADAFVKIFEAVAPLLPALLDLALQLLPPLVDVLTVLIPPLVEVAQTLFPALVQVILALAPVLPPLMDAFVKLIEAILPILPLLTQLIVYLLPPLTELIKLMIPVMTFWIEVWTKVIEIIVAVITWVVQLITQWRDARDAMVEIALAIRDWVVAAFRQLIDWIQAAFQAFVDWTIGLWTSFRDSMVGLAQNILDWIIERFTSLRDGAVNLFQNILDWVMERFTAMRDGISNLAHSIWDTVVGVFSDMRDVVIGIFHALVEGVRVVFDTIMDVVATPINFVIEVIFNRGLFTAWNWIVDHIGLDANWHAPHWAQLPRGAHFADGGVIQGYSPSPRADNIPIMATAGEFVVQQPIATRTGAFLTALNAGQPEAIQAAGGWYGNGPVGNFATGGLVAAQQYAEAQRGKPYIWGGVGPAGFDCSGFMSALTNVLRGKAPNVRVGTTASFPWPGFTPGLTSSFAIGNTKNAFNSGVGHMAGTLGGRAVESGSGHGPMIDGNALSATAALFGQHASLPEASGVYAAATGGVTIEDPWYVKLWHTVEGVFTWLKDSIKDVASMVTRFGNNDFVKMIKEMPGVLVGGLWGKIKDTVAALFASGTTGDGNNTAPAGLDAIKSAVQSVFATKGWGGGNQWAATDWLVQKESSWNPKAQNPTSTASGLFQHIDGTWRAFRPAGSTAAHMKDATISQQAYAGMGYIGTGGNGARPFRDPLGAKSFHEANGWYDSGGWLPPGVTTVYNGSGRPEPVLTAGEHDGLMRMRTTTKTNDVPALSAVIRNYFDGKALHDFVVSTVTVMDAEDQLDRRST